MKRPGDDLEQVPEQCRWIRMNNQDDGEEEEFSVQYCWQTLGHDDDEAVPVDQFPLRRRGCDFFPLGASHENHEANRVQANFVAAIRLLTTLQGSVKECSDQDCEYSAFMQILQPPLPNRELDTIRAHLNEALMCDTSHSTICRIPIDEVVRLSFVLGFFSTSVIAGAQQQDAGHLSHASQSGSGTDSRRVFDSISRNGSDGWFLLSRCWRQRNGTVEHVSGGVRRLHARLRRFGGSLCRPGGYLS